jgi:hypothetical protein
MDQTNNEPTNDNSVPKKTLREISANATYGLILMRQIHVASAIGKAGMRPGQYVSHFWDRPHRDF